MGAIVAVGLVLSLTLLEFPLVPYDIDHDLSSSASYEYFAARGFQFGTQIVQNVGPLGWIHYGAVYAGFLHDEKLVLKALTRLLFVALLLWSCTRFRSRVTQVAWLLAFVALLPIGDASDPDFLEVNDVWAYLSAYLSGICLLNMVENRRSRSLAPCFSSSWPCSP